MRDRYMPAKVRVLERRIARKQAQARLAELQRMRRLLINAIKRYRTAKKYKDRGLWTPYKAAYRAKHKTKIREDKNLRRRGRIPKFADRAAMKLIYRKRIEWSVRLGYELHVDHIVPMNNACVSGLHCEANLQLLAVPENVLKSNAFWPDCPWE
jgi:hypothetical protein